MNPLISCPRLETDRLVLRELRMEDADFLFNQWSDPCVTQFMCDQEPLQTREQADAFLRPFQTPEDNPFIKWWGIGRKPGGNLIGTCGFFRWDGQHHRAEIGYDLHPDTWGRGLMPEAIHALIRYGFSEMNLNRIEATVHDKNFRSQRVLGKLGFKQEGVLREYYCRKGIYNNQIQYSLLKREWLSGISQPDPFVSAHP